MDPSLARFKMYLSDVPVTNSNVLIQMIATTIMVFKKSWNDELDASN